LVDGFPDGPFCRTLSTTQFAMDVKAERLSSNCSFESGLSCFAPLTTELGSPRLNASECLSVYIAEPGGATRVVARPVAEWSVTSIRQAHDETETGVTSLGFGARRRRDADGFSARRRKMALIGKTACQRDDVTTARGGSCSRRSKSTSRSARPCISSEVAGTSGSNARRR
jgi:hypothetical protein